MNPLLGGVGVGSDKGHRTQGRRTVCGMRGDEDEWENGGMGEWGTARPQDNVLCIMDYRRCINNWQLAISN